MWIKDNNGNLININMVSSIDNRNYGSIEGKIDNRIAIYGNAEVPMNTYQFESAERCQEIIDEIEFYINNRLGAHKDCFKAIYTMPKE